MSRLYEIGEVVQVIFPNQEDKTKGTLRKAIVIEDLQDEVELCFMTSKLDQKLHYPDSFIIDKTSADGIAMGLSYTSLIAPSKLEILPKRRLFNASIKYMPECLFEQLEKLINKHR